MNNQLQKKDSMKVPEPTLRRLPWYLSNVKLLRKRGERFVSSTQISKEINIDASQIAKDLSYVNISGRTRVGYDIDTLIAVLEDFLGFTNIHKAFLFGVGSLGGALLRDSGLSHFGLEIVAAFDVNPDLVGTTLNGIPIFHSDDFEKKMREYKLSKGETEGNGDCYTCMGCRSFLTPDRSGNGWDNVANAGNYQPDKPKYYGRFNQGVVTINLPDVALSALKVWEATGDHNDIQNLYDTFWEIFDERLELCHKALQIRHERLSGTLSDASPIHWQYGALARLKKGETIDKLLHGGYSTISLGYAGLYECVMAMTGKSHTDPDGEPFALKVMQYMNDKCAAWKAAEDIDYSLYGTPIESTTYKFAKCLQKRFGVIEGITDKGYITNSYHVHVTEHINAFDKLRFESQFQKLSPGGAISYIEVANLSDNIPAVLTVLKYIYDNIMYAELNTKSDYCQVCGWDKEIEIVDDDRGKLIWKCPNCGNTDKSKMNIARRTCGYIGLNDWNQGRTQEIKERYVHLGGDE